MIKQDNISSQSIIQISLFQYKAYSVRYIYRSVIMGIVSALMICVGIYSYTFSQSIILYLITIILILFFILLFRLFDYWFPKSTDTLVIAFGELQLLKDHKIQRYENIQNLSIQNHLNTTIPLLEIKGNTFPKTTIGLKKHFRLITFKKEREVNYIIYSQKNWDILQQYLTPTT